MSTYKKGFLTIIGLIIITGTALAYVGSQSASIQPTPPPVAGTKTDGLVSVSASLAQSKVLVGSDGKVSMAVRLTAVALPRKDDQPNKPVDLVVVLDRSGSMNGQKINDACGAIIKLMECLTPRDRLALVTYSDNVTSVSGLLAMDGANRVQLAAAINQVRANGGTNLSGGLQSGIDTLLQTNADGHQRKVILISDGLANQGITDPKELGQMASAAVEHNFSISSVGVGLDFNEVLMTALADHGTGRYYFLENPGAFAQVFEDEFQTARKVAAAGLELRIPLKDGVRLTHAGGYPISCHKGYAMVHPGDLLSGQDRQLFLTFEIPADQEGQVTFEEMKVGYQHQGKAKTLTVPLGLTVACVPDPGEVVASVDEKTWSDQVLQEDFSRLKTTVADAIRNGERDKAEAEIQAYEVHNQQLNAVVGSAAVSKNLNEDVRKLREGVKETFSGAPAAVAEKRKQQAKTLQYDGYQIRRDQKK
ncbi:MAG: VWA domain-containing protein [Proteobacteria bacterium]|nr:VWA domain-containing protein [Pseudomonadota bacterium]MBU4469685.1 VWA domain-containing protein [Pseudomonadota bacterium]MCG2751768.1 VWA domain-containing protein [Desulfobacteraceae bacterium]